MKQIVKEYIEQTITILMIISIALSLHASSILAISKLAPKTDYVVEERLINLQYKEVEYDHKQARKDINKLCHKIPVFFRDVENLTQDKGVYGRTNAILRYIEMDKNLPDNEYIFYYTHELMHLKHTENDERTTNYCAFIALYESGNEDFKVVAEWYALQDMYKCISQEYSCWNRIYEYLTQKGV